MGIVTHFCTCPALTCILRCNKPAPSILLPRNAMSVRPISFWVARTQVKKLCQYKAKIFDKPNFATKIISTKTNLCWKMDNVSINCFSSCASVAGHLEITWSNKERDVAWCLMDFLHKKLAHFCGRRSLSVLIDIWRTWNRQFVEKTIFFAHDLICQNIQPHISCQQRLPGKTEWKQCSWTLF